MGLKYLCDLCIVVSMLVCQVYDTYPGRTTDQGSLRSRIPRRTSSSSHSQVDDTSGDSSGTVNWRRILLLIIAITVHNIPGIIKDH